MVSIPNTENFSQPNMSTKNINNEGSKSEYSKNSKLEVIQEAIREKLSLNDIKTDADFDSLSIEKRLEIDDRSFWVLFWEKLKKDHNLLNLIFFKSIVKPLWMRITGVMFQYSLDFALNAVFFSSDLINSQAQEKEKKGEEAIG
eukprot:CAMPEP_0170539902 /NCGR_PEP_ID=MMETSP0209-20121228/104293_1 /TAXON_ID=665100 ORGANISM="Litonotus pictus, Strain P1" /NCGR_SAMPLE_ID=MMETSP0209 /ASSEMBLY_ACC=CAM_ASM_000301 /LENGTH=143 /DNA_ID=CAMNT_0010842091 /DNA_START=547 /DNA_END=974 /DNA_ORIENTATION=-